MTSASSAAGRRSPQGSFLPQAVHRATGSEPLEFPATPTPSASGKPDGSEAPGLRTPFRRAGSDRHRQGPSRRDFSTTRSRYGDPHPPQGVSEPRPRGGLAHAVRDHPGHLTVPGFGQDRTPRGPLEMHQQDNKIVKLTPRELLRHQRRELRKLRDREVLGGGRQKDHRHGPGDGQVGPQGGQPHGPQGGPPPQVRLPHRAQGRGRLQETSI